MEGGWSFGLRCGIGVGGIQLFLGSGFARCWGVVVGSCGLWVGGLGRVGGVEVLTDS